MTAYASNLDIFNDALLRLGEPPIQEGDGGGKAMIYRGSMRGIIQSTLRRHKFGFCRKQSSLPLQGPDERDGYFVYQKPGDCILVHSVLHENGRILRQYDTRSDKIITPYEHDNLWMLHTYSAPASDWNADICEVILMRVQAVLLKAILEDGPAAREMRREASDLLLEAIARDKFENPPERWIYEPGLARHVHTRNRIYPVTGYARS